MSRMLNSWWSKSNVIDDVGIHDQVAPTCSRGHFKVRFVWRPSCDCRPSVHSGCSGYDCLCVTSRPASPHVRSLSSLPSHMEPWRRHIDIQIITSFSVRWYVETNYNVYRRLREYIMTTQNVRITSSGRTSSQSGDAELEQTLGCPTPGNSFPEPSPFRPSTHPHPYR